MAVAPAVAAAQATLTREAEQYHLVMTDAGDSLRIQGGAANNAPLLDFVPSGASAAPWTLSAPACNQNPQTYAVRCTQDVAPLTVETGAGDDTVTASSSNVAVWLDGGAGKDTLTAGPGDDTVVSRDDAADTVDCGPGNDTAIADASDTVTNCERVDIPPPPPAPKPSPSPLPSPSPASTSTPAPAPLTRIGGTIANSFVVGSRTARVARLLVRGAPVGSRIALTCRGRGCPRRSLSGRGPDASFTKALKHARLRIGAVLELRLTAPNVIGRVVRFTVAKRRVRSATLCLAPGAAAPARC